MQFPATWDLQPSFAFSNFCKLPVYHHTKGLSAATDNIRCKRNTPFAKCPFMHFTVGYPLKLLQPCIGKRRFWKSVCTTGKSHEEGVQLFNNTIFRLRSLRERHTKFPMSFNLLHSWGIRRNIVVTSCARHLWLPSVPWQGSPVPPGRWGRPCVGAPQHILY